MTSASRRAQVLVLSAALVLVGCGDDASPMDGGAADVPTDVADDSALVDSTIGDIGPGEDAALDMAGDLGRDTAVVDAGFVDQCEGPCATTDLMAVFGASSAPFTLAYYGLNVDGTLRVEVYGGAAEGCPSMDSPTPERTLILADVPAFTDRVSAAVVASMLDFGGDLVPAPVVRASSAMAQGVAARLIGDGLFVRFDLMATFEAGEFAGMMFEGGTVRGAVYATHCTSLDE